MTDPFRPREKVTANQNEKGDWAINQALLPQVIEKIRKCKACNKTLSKYNTGDYCFIHQDKENESLDENVQYTPRRKRKAKK